MVYINKEELLEMLKERYGDIGDICGCRCNGEWLSLANIVEIINECCEYED